MSDVILFQTPDGGEITVENGQVAMDNGLATAALLSMFGGNQDDSGLTADAKKQWWGNLSEPDRSRHYRSETQYLLRSLPQTSENRKRIEDAVGRDLAWMTTQLGAQIEVQVTVPALGRVNIAGTILIDGKKFPIEFVTAWSANR